jgi:hypothetical protein
MNDSTADQLGSLSTPNPSATVLVEMADLDAVATAFCQRAGEPRAEAHRRATLHDVLDASRALAGALEEFARAGGAHYRGVHCTSHMQAEMQRLAQRLTSWSDAILSAGTAQREWQLGAAGPIARPRGDDLERRLADAFPGLAVQATAPVQVSQI